MQRLDRLQAILTALQSKRVVKAEELATRFEVSIRTIYRDIRSLEEGGVPIGAEAGIGYFLDESYHLPPVMFTQAEARALLLAGKIVEQFTDETTFKLYNDALTKVRAVLDIDKKEELELLDTDIIINPFPSEKQSNQETLFIDQVKQSLASSKVISIQYKSKGKNELTDRELEPIGLCYYYGGWHIMAYCRLREDYRDFRLDRIQKLTVINESYSRFKHPKIQEYIDKIIDETELELCIIEVDKSVHRYLDQMKYQMGLVKEEVKNDTVVMHFATFSYDYIARWILMFGTYTHEIEPKELKEIVIQFSSNLANKFNPRKS